MPASASKMLVLGITDESHSKRLYLQYIPECPSRSPSAAAFIAALISSYVAAFSNPNGQDQQRRNVGCRHTESHAREFAVKLWNNLAHSFGRAGGRLGMMLNAAPLPPRQSFFGRPINRFLCCRRCMDCRHQAFNDAEVVINDFGQRCQDSSLCRTH